MCENICTYYVFSGGFWRCLKKGDRRNCVLCEWEGHGLSGNEPCCFFQEETCYHILDREDQIMRKTRTQTIRNNHLFKKLVKGLQEIGRELLPSNNEEDEKIAYSITHYSNGYCIDELLPYPWDMKSIKLIQDEEGQGVLLKEEKWSYLIRPKLVCKFYNGKKCIHYRIGGKKCSLNGYEGECDSFQEPCRLAGKWACEEKGEPKIQIKIKGEDLDLVQELQKSGNARLIKDFVLYEPTLDKDKGFVIPEIIRQKEKTLCIHASEMYTKESATIVCGLSGKALRPYHIPSIGLHCCTTHASIHSYFSIPLQVITIDYTKEDGNITIYHHQILSDEDIVYLEKKVVWKSHYKDLPKKYEKYLTAVNAAVKKANCYLVHYSFSNIWES